MILTMIIIPYIIMNHNVNVVVIIKFTKKKSNGRFKLSNI